MKNLSKKQTFLLENLIASLPLIFMMIWWKQDVLLHLKGMIFYLAYLLIFFSMHLFVYFKNEKVSKNSLLESFYVFLLGSIFCFDAIFSTFNFELSIAVCVALYLMYDGNKQALIPQDAPNAGLMYAYDEKAYKKSQRMWGRVRFGFGFVVLITFLAIPKEFYLHAFFILSIAYYIATFIWLFKSSKAAI